MQHHSRLLIRRDKTCVECKLLENTGFSALGAQTLESFSWLLTLRGMKMTFGL